MTTLINFVYLLSLCTRVRPSFACHDQSTSVAFSLRSTEMNVNVGSNCLHEFSNCLLEPNVSCEAVLVHTTRPNAFVHSFITIKESFSSNSLPKTCVITTSWTTDDFVISCSKMYSYRVENKTVVLIRETVNSCYRVGFIALNNVTIVEQGLIKEMSTAAYHPNFCDETPTTAATSTQASVSTVGHSFSTLNTSVNNEMTSTNDKVFLTSANVTSLKVESKGSNDKTLIIALCAVFGTLIFVSIVVTATVHIRKRKRKKENRDAGTDINPGPSTQDRSLVTTRSSNKTLSPPVYNNITHRHEIKLSDFDERNETSDSLGHDANAHFPKDEKYEEINLTYLNFTDQVKDKSFVTDDIGYLMPSPNANNAIIIQSSDKVTAPSDNSVNSIYEEIEGKFVSTSVRNKTELFGDNNESVYEECRDKTKPYIPTSDTPYQNMTERVYNKLGQPVRLITDPYSVEGKPKADKEIRTGNTLSGNVSEELEDVCDITYDIVDPAGLSDNSEHLTIDHDYSNDGGHVTADPNVQKDPVYFILEDPDLYT
ncbi:uncharacterized protein LOC106059580 [Biomphalaria glabrata]|uniref:Uncharacterized protein LOC106059580 n=1 Tax=Biomphalaria glabrata TaxID=6526 RepID=A0A9W2YDX0_BIOGL|nr:uncharacterized protein LOC106059580 [Biomphalaria glabrata]